MRRLAAIMAADVVGYSRLMEQDEAGTLAALKERRKEVLEPLVAKHRGRIFKVTGDGVLVEFASAVSAVQCAIELQQGMEAANAGQAEDRHIVLRVGVNLGDVMVEGGDLYGDGVNIAARLQALAETGGVCISAAVHEQITTKLRRDITDLGLRDLKNIARPVRVFRVLPQERPAVAADAGPPLPAKPSIAVLPFDNLSGDPDQAHFADGVVEEITAALSRVRSFFVIARNSTVAYTGRPVQAARIARELGVRYLLQGTVRTAGTRLRISVQLVDAVTGTTLWADRYEGQVEDVFDLQDQITERIVGAIEPSVRSAEIERVRRKRPDSLEAYDYVMRALPHVWALTPSGNAEALRLTGEAIRLDPGFARATALAGWCHVWQVVNGWSADPVEAGAKGLKLARQALAVDGDDPTVLTMVGAAEMMLAGDLRAASALISKALALDPNSAWAWIRSGYLHAYSGDAETALEHFQRARRLSPFDPLTFNCYAGIALAHFVVERYGDAVVWAEKARAERPGLPFAYRVLAASYAQLGRDDQARSAVQTLLANHPTMSLLQVMTTMPLEPAEVRSRFEAALRKSGMPE